MKPQDSEHDAFGGAAGAKEDLIWNGKTAPSTYLYEQLDITIARL
jgi:hypothetical protein